MESVISPMYFLCMDFYASYLMYTTILFPFGKAHFWLKVIGIWAAIVTGIVEEVIARYVLVDCLFTIVFSPILQILIFGLFFGIAHSTFKRGVENCVPCSYLYGNLRKPSRNFLDNGWKKHSCSNCSSYFV